MEIFLDKKGFDEISNYITELRKSLNDIRKEKGHAYMEDSNTWHDNYAFEFANAREIDLLDQIENQLNTYNEAKLVERGNDRTVCDIDDQIFIRFFDNFGFEDEQYTLVAKNLNIKSDEISLNSPLGMAIYKQKFDSDICFETDNKIQVKIKLMRK